MLIGWLWANILTHPLEWWDFQLLNWKWNTTAHRVEENEQTGMKLKPETDRFKTRRGCLNRAKGHTNSTVRVREKVVLFRHFNFPIMSGVDNIYWPSAELLSLIQTHELQGRFSLGHNMRWQRKGCYWNMFDILLVCVCGNAVMRLEAALGTTRLP